MQRRPLSVTATLIFILLNSLIWLAFSVIVFAGAHPALPDQPLIRWSMAILSLITAGLLIGLFVTLRRQSQIAYFLALALFSAIILLTILDEFGVADLIVLTFNIVPIALLLKDRSWYLWGRYVVRSREIEPSEPS